MKQTSSCDSVEANPPWYAECGETLDQTYDGCFAAQICIASPWVAEEACSARGCNNLAFPSLVAAIISFVEQLQKCKDRIIQRGAIQAVRCSEVRHGCFPSMLHKVGQSMARFQVLEHWSGHSCIGD